MTKAEKAEHRLISAHVREAGRKRAEITNLGWGYAPEFGNIHSKTTKGILMTYVGHANRIYHVWRKR